MLLRLSALALVVTLFGACGPASTGSSASLPGATPGTTILAATSGDVDSVTSPEDVDITLVWTVTRIAPDGTEQITSERFQADGLGKFALGLEGVFNPNTQQFEAPDVTTSILAQSRAGFRVRYRAPHFYDEPSIYLHYGVYKEEQTVVVAGVTCHRVHFESLYGRGNTVMLVDESNDVMIGWESYDESDELRFKVVPSSVVYGGDHSGAAWVNATSNRRPYQGAVDHAVLGFTPRTATFLPAGYGLLSQHVLELQPAMNNILLQVYSDGLHMLFVAQQSEPDTVLGNVQTTGLGTSTNTGPATPTVEPMRQAWHVEVGQMRLIEGARAGLRVFAVGSLSYDDLLTVFASVR